MEQQEETKGSPFSSWTFEPFCGYSVLVISRAGRRSGLA
jgi:hypothetical protein